MITYENISDAHTLLGQKNEEENQYKHNRILASSVLEPLIMCHWSLFAKYSTNHQINKPGFQAAQYTMINMFNKQSDVKYRMENFYMNGRPWQDRS